MSRRPSPSSAAGKTRAQPRAMLFYGNQPYAVEQAARDWENTALGDAPRDFCYFRFDAAELLKPGSDPAAARVDALEEACRGLPLLGERVLVRLDHVEAVRPTERAAQTLQKSLEALRVRPLTTTEGDLWVAEQAVRPGENPGPARPAATWVERVESAPGVGAVIHLTAEAEHARFGLGEERQAVPLQAFLRANLKGRFAFPEDEPTDGERQASSGGDRLHRELESLLGALPPHLWLLLTADAARESDLPRALLALAKAHGQVQRFVTYGDQGDLPWVLEEAQRRGLRLSRQGAAQLVERVGSDMGALAATLERVSLLAGPGERLSEQALLQAVQGQGNAPVFALSERLAERDLAGALRVLGRFLTESPAEHPVLIGVLARRLREWHGLLARQESPAQAASRLKLPPFVARQLHQQAQGFSLAELERMQQVLARLDVAAKLHGALTRLLFEDFIAAVCQGAFRHPAAAQRLEQLAR